MKKILDYYGKEINEEEAKKTACAEYQYDDAKEALIDLILDRKSRKFHYETTNKISEITKPLIHKGLKLEAYIVWNKHVFINMAGFYLYSGEISE